MSKKLIPIRLSDNTISEINRLKSTGFFDSRTDVMERAIERGISYLKREVKDKRFFLIYFFLSMLFMNYSSLIFCITLI